MKRKIILVLILMLELVFFIVHGIYDELQLPEVFDIINVMYDALIDNFVTPLVNIFNLTNFVYGEFIVILFLNFIFILLYYIVFGILTGILNNVKMKKVKRVVMTSYQLTPTEEEKFSCKRYMRKFPKIRVLSFIIPLSFLAIIFLARLDKEYVKLLDIESNTDLIIYTENIKPFINLLFGSDEFLLNIFTNKYKIGYVDIAKHIPQNLFYLEYVLMGVITIIVLFLWYGILSLLYLPFRKLCARRRARRARNKFIFRKDIKEYKLRTKHKKSYSSKSKEFMSIIEKEEKDQQVLAQQLDSQNMGKENLKPSEYYDDLGQGVKDLGVGTSYKEKKDKAIIEREVRYISDSDFDIELEEEPVIEIVEEDSIGQIRQQTKDDELYYEKYQPDDLLIKPVEEYQSNLSKVNDYVSTINEIDNNEINNEELLSSNEMHDDIQDDNDTIEPKEKVESLYENDKTISLEEKPLEDTEIKELKIEEVEPILLIQQAEENTEFLEEVEVETEETNVATSDNEIIEFSADKDIPLENQPLYDEDFLQNNQEKEIEVREVQDLDENVQKDDVKEKKQRTSKPKVKESLSNDQEKIKQTNLSDKKKSGSRKK